MENKYLLLRTIAVLCEIAAWLILIVGVLATSFLVASGGAFEVGLRSATPLASYWRQLGLPTVTAMVAAGVTGVTTLLSFLVLYALGELILLLLDIAQNTREMAQYLRPGV